MIEIRKGHRLTALLNWFELTRQGTNPLELAYHGLSAFHQTFCNQFKHYLRNGMPLSERTYVGGEVLMSVAAWGESLGRSLQSSNSLAALILLNLSERVITENCKLIKLGRSSLYLLTELKGN